jgi:hypothetical protein
VVPVVQDETDEFKKRQKKKREKMIEQRKKLELKKLKRRLKKAKKNEKKIIQEKIERIEKRQKQVQEDNFEIIVNTLANKRKARERELKAKKEEEEVRRELVRKGELEDQIYINSRRYRMDGDELQDLVISKIKLILYRYIFSYFLLLLKSIC